MTARSVSAPSARAAEGATRRKRDGGDPEGRASRHDRSSRCGRPLDRDQHHHQIVRRPVMSIATFAERDAGSQDRSRANRLGATIRRTSSATSPWQVPILFPCAGRREHDSAAVAGRRTNRSTVCRPPPPTPGRRRAVDQANCGRPRGYRRCGRRRDKRPCRRTGSPRLRQADSRSARQRMRGSAHTLDQFERAAAPRRTTRVDARARAILSIAGVALDADKRRPRQLGDGAGGAGAEREVEHDVARVRGGDSTQCSRPSEGFWVRWILSPASSASTVRRRCRSEWSNPTASGCR